MSDARPALLVVFPQCLDIWGHGSMQRLLALADYLARHGVDIDLVYQGQEGVPARDLWGYGFRRVLRVAGWGSWLDPQILDGYDEFYLGHETPGPHLLPSPAMCALVRSLLDALDYRAVMCTYAWTAPMLAAGAHGALRILDVQDIMFQHGTRCAKATGETTVFSLSEATERFLWSRWDVLLAITGEEADTLRPALSPLQRLHVVPHAIGALADGPAEGQASLVYTSSDNTSNLYALRWFLAEVWPAILAARPDVTLEIAGLICRAIAPEAQEASNVRLHGFVESIAALIDGAGVVVAPYLFGSGLKIKVVEAAARGKAIVTTRHGIPGTGLRHEEHLLVADTPRAFADAVLRLLASSRLRRRLGGAALAHARASFSEDACYGAVLAEVAAARVPQRDRSRELQHAARRVTRALRSLPGARLVVWGNGSHTRALLAALAVHGVEAGVIVDGRATAASTSPEGPAVVPGRDYRRAAEDLVVLSSENFEAEMWRDLASLRAAGAHVLALYQRHLVTPGLRERMLADPGRA